MNIVIYSILSAAACRFKIIGWLAKKYKTPKEAERCLSGRSKNITSHKCASVQTDDMDVTTIMELFDSLSTETKLKALSKLFTSYMYSTACVTVPDDFLSCTAKAMVNLRSSRRTNVLYNLAKGIGTPRKDGSGSRFPTDCMPMGLVEYTASFYVCDNVNQVLKDIAH